MKVHSVFLILLVLAASVALAGCTGPAAAPAETAPEAAQHAGTAAMQALAQEIAASVNAGLAGLDAGLYETSQALSATGLSGADAEKAISKNLLKDPWAVSAVTISKDGIVMAAVPPGSAGGVGTDLSGMAPVITANGAKAPLVSGVFTAVEGFSAVSQSCPVYSPAGEYLGYVDIVYEPQVFLARQIGNVTPGPEYSVWVAQADGTQLYDIKGEEIGKNILTDPSYSDPVLHETLARIAAEPNGTGTYAYWDSDWNRFVTKEAVWETAGLDGAVWRVVVTKDSGTAAAAAPSVAPAAATDSRVNNLTEFVDNAAAYAAERGREAALAEFNDANGSLSDGDLYVFAYGSDGTVLALPYQQGVHGTDRTGIANPNGVKFIDRMKEIARGGGGYLYYIYANPADDYREEFKLSYVRPVDGTWFVGSGIYLPEIPAQFNLTEKDLLVERVKQARAYALENGPANAIRAFNDRNGTFADGSRYIFAYGYNGTTLAMPFQPEAIGTDRTDFSDTHGVKVAAWEIAVARSGGGFVYVDYLNPDTGEAGIKLCYVTPAGDDWLVGSGIYTSRV